MFWFPVKLRMSFISLFHFDLVLHVVLHRKLKKYVYLNALSGKSCAGRMPVHTGIVPILYRWVFLLPFTGEACTGTILLCTGIITNVCRLILLSFKKITSKLHRNLVRFLVCVQILCIEITLQEETSDFILGFSLRLRDSKIHILILKCINSTLAGQHNSTTFLPLPRNMRKRRQIQWSSTVSRISSPGCKIFKGCKGVQPTLCHCFSRPLFQDVAFAKGGSEAVFLQTGCLEKMEALRH